MTPIVSRMNPCERHPGAEPLPGYRLLKLLGRGGFGEVWRCEAPGRLHKAVKFVAGGGDQFRVELAAFEQVRTIRHPYLMTLERVEVVSGELVMVMELADGQVNDRFRACVGEGLRGIPREELLSYLKEAAEALDFLSSRHKLQHLDVKPENLLLLAGHVKVGDYGLVRGTDGGRVTDLCPHGFTPRYSAPEVLNGSIDSRSDQYSLALVYAELLTGKFPFSGQTPQQLLMQHITAAPDLSALGSGEREIVKRALAKDPKGRFASCSAFIRALVAADAGEVDNDVSSRENTAAAETRANATWRKIENSSDASNDTIVSSIPPLGGEGAAFSLAKTTPTVSPLVGVLNSRQAARRNIAQRKETPPPARTEKPPLIVSLDRLNGMPAHKVNRPCLSMHELVTAVVEVAARDCGTTNADGPTSSLTIRFLCTVPAALIPLKLAVIANPRNLKIDQSDPRLVVLRSEARPKLPPSGKVDPRILAQQPKSGFELFVHLPIPPCAELTIAGTLFGNPDSEFVQKANAEMPAIMEEIKSLLHNKSERRAHPRFPADFHVLAYPRYSDGEVGTPIVGQCRDVSEGGVRFATPVPIRTSQIYLEFKDLDQVAGVAVLVQVIRTVPEPGGQEFLTVGRFGINS